MHASTFYPPKSSLSVTITVDDEHITFYLGQQFGRELYWIGIDDWKHPASTFPEHMETKVWFTSEMREFINKSLDIPDHGRPARHDSMTEDDEEIAEIMRQNNGIIRGSDIKHIVMRKYQENS